MGSILPAHGQSISSTSFIGLAVINIMIEIGRVVKDVGDV
jgi:hypothetical protein